MYFLKRTVGLKKWLTRSGPITPQFPLQIDALKNACCNWGSGRLYQILRLIVKHIYDFIQHKWIFFISCCYTYFLDSKYKTDFFIGFYCMKNQKDQSINLGNIHSVRNSFNWVLIHDVCNPSLTGRTCGFYGCRANN